MCCGECEHQENVKVTFGVFVSGNHILEVYVFVNEIFGVMIASRSVVHCIVVLADPISYM